MAIKYVGKQPAKPSEKIPYQVWDDHLTEDGAPPATTNALKSGKVVANVSVSKKKASESSPFVATSEQQDVMPVGLIPLHKLAHVHVSGSQTINLGNYESSKITVGITFPCNVDEINDAYEFSSDWVSNKLTEVMLTLKEGKS